MRFADPGDIARFTDRLTDLVGSAIAEFDTPSGGGRYRIVVGGHPKPQEPKGEQP